jgi:acyl carrier protein
MTIQEIEKKVKEIIVKKLQVDTDEVKFDSSFTDDLGADSLDTVELIMELEDQFNISISNELADKMGPTVGDAYEAFFRAAPRDFIKSIDSRIICFRFRSDGKIEVILKFEDGSWCYADGTTVLPSTICLLTFTRWANILKELENIINDPRTKEADLQKYFETYPELLAGDDYDVVLPQAVIVNDDNSIWKSDFVLTPKNQYEFSKVLELKIPKLNIVNRPKSGHVTFSSKVWNAIQQIRDYSRAFDNKAIRERFKKTYNVDVFKPDLHLIAGRKWDINIMDSLRQLQRETPVKIEDWDTVLDRLKRNYA